MMFCGSLPSAKNPARLLTRTAFVVALLFLSGCLDYEEEMWLNSDLSGRVAMTISLKEEIVRGTTGFEKDLTEEGIRRDVERIPGVKLESFESFRDSGRMIAKIRLTFDSIEKLTRHETGVADSSPASFLGAVTVRQEGGKVVIERSLRALPTTKSKGTAEDILSKGIGSLLFSKNYLAYKLHVPGELITANTQHIEGKAGTVEWKYTLAQAIREPPTMRVEWRKPFPIMGITIGGFVLTAVIALVLKKRGKKIG